MRTINLDDVLPVLEQLVAEFGPDYEYQQVILPEREDQPFCLYVYNGTPSCGVGHVLHRLGIPLEPLTEAYTSSVGQRYSYNELDFNHNELRDYLRKQGVEFTTEAAVLLNSFQVAQDEGQPWGAALNTALADTQQREEY